MSSELLSAALDGECTPEELDRLLAELERSPELKAQWSRLCLARDALGGARLKQRSICEAVMGGLGDAPSEKVVAMVSGKRRAIPWRPIASLATAAAVATVAFTLGYRSPNVAPVSIAKAPEGPTTVTVPVAATSKQVSAIETVPVAVSRSTTRRYGWESLEQERDARQLNTYLIDYSSYRAGAGMSDTLGYARFAAHTAEYNADR
jgi:negative regulator of sigma E activity